MTAATWSILLMWIVLLIYSLAGSIDFGAGFWGMFLYRRHAEASALANRYISPLWEVTNVFLVLFAVGFVGFFPEAAFLYGTVLLIPGSLILILLALRGSFLVFAYTTKKNEQALRIVSGLTGVLLPALFVTVLPISEGGFVTYTQGHYALQFTKLLSSPVAYAYLTFGVATELFFSALMMADYARAASKEKVYAIFRKAAIRLGPLTLISAFAVQWLMPGDSGWMQAHLNAAWPAFLASLIAFAVGYGALWMTPTHRLSKGRPRLAVISIVVQYAIAQFAYGWAHLPYMLYPYLTVEKAFTNGAMFNALFVVMVAGIAVLFPAFVWFWRLFMEDKTYLAGEKK